MTRALGKTAVLRQRTLKRAIHCRGVGLHSGVKAEMTIRPAEPDTGIVFVRSDAEGGGARIPALWGNVVDTRLCTVIGDGARATIGTIEHLMAALRGCDIDNAVVDVEGPEVPVMDGSAEPFVFLLDCAGSEEQAAPRRCIRVLKEVMVGDEARTASLEPGVGSTYSFEIEFPNRVIARQTAAIPLVNGNFRSEIARARTFGFLHEVDQLRRLGLARGGSLENAIVISDEKILNQGGLRFGDEFVRHKILDSIGDLYLAGLPIVGHYHGYKAGHALHNILLHALFADPSAWCHDTLTEDDATCGGWEHHEERRAVNG